MNNKAICRKTDEHFTEGKEYECTANVYRTSDGRKIEMTVSLSNALLGGVPEYIASVAKGK